jgi:hypothetical protein
MSDILNDTEWLNKMRDSIKPDEAVFPIAIRIGKSFYKIHEIADDTIFKDTSITASNFRVVFGSIYNMFRLRASFPISKSIEYNILKRIQTIDEKTQVDTLFFVFESDYIEYNNNEEISKFDEEINDNYVMLFDYVKSITDINRKKRLASFREMVDNIKDKLNED